jgi:excisionase family DNA binding protein
MPNDTLYLLTMDEVAEATRLSVRSVRRAIQRGDLPTVRLGRAVRIQSGDLVDFIERHTHSSNLTLDPEARR